MLGNSIFGIISLTRSTLVDDISRCSVNWVASADCVRVCDMRHTPVPISTIMVFSCCCLNLKLGICGLAPGALNSALVGGGMEY